MERISLSDALNLCRLCGRSGNHKTNILECDADSAGNNKNRLSDKVFRCVGILVRPSDKVTTKVCETCVTKIDYIIRFRKVCAMTDIQLRILLASLNESDDTFESAIETLSELSTIANEIETVDDGGVGQNDERLSTGKRKCADMESGDSETNRTKTMRRERDPDLAAPSIDVRSTVDISNTNVNEGNENTNYEYLEMDLDLPSNERNIRPPNDHANEQDIIEQNDHSDCDILEPEANATQLQSRSHNCTVDNTTESRSGSNDDVVKPEIGAAVDISRNPRKRMKYVAATKKKGVNSKATDNARGNEFKCLKCKGSYESLDAMTYHKANFHARGIKKTFCCHLCKKTSGNKQMLQRHMNGVHNREIRFMCPIRSCAKIFTQKCDLKRHTNGIHTKAVAFKCTKCSMKFYRKESMIRHLANSHGKGITFSCYLCKKQLSSKYSLECHMNGRHTGKGSFICPIRSCGKIFIRKGNLEEHTNGKHSKEVAFKCTMCPMKFYWKSILTKHLANKHS